MNNSLINLDKNLVLWLETTSDRSFISSEKVDTALGATGTISTWNDLNLQAYPRNNAIQATTANKPRYIADGINGLPVVNFDGNSDFFPFDGTALVNSNYTIFVVEQRRSGKTNNGFIAGKGTGDNQLLFLSYNGTNTNSHLYIYYT